MKNYLIGFTIVLISIFSFCTSVSASEAITVEYSSSLTFTFYSPEHYGYKYGFLFYTDTGYKTPYYYLSNDPLGITVRDTGSISIVSYYDDYVSTGFSFLYSSTISLSTELSDFKTKTGNVSLSSGYTMLWSNYDVPEVVDKLSTGNIYHYSDIKSDLVFSEIVSTSLYSSVEVIFDIPTVTEICTRDEYIDGVLTEVEYVCPMLDLEYEFFNSDVNGVLSNMSFGIPYIEKKYLYDTGSSSINKTDTIPFSDGNSSYYSGNQVIDFDVSITKLKLIIPLDFLKYSYVNLNFKSNISYTVNYIERDSSTIDFVDITGKAGVMFIPKQIDDDMLMGFDFAQTGLYSLQLRDTYKSNYNILAYYSIGYCDGNDFIDSIPVICSSGNSYSAYINFEKGNLEQSLFVVNENFPNSDVESIVYYDSNYFTYVIYEKLYSTPTFTHPVTNEENVSNDLLDYDSKLYEDENKGFFSQVISAFDYFKDSAFTIIEDISFFWDGLSITLKYFYMIIFSIILFGFLIRFIL